MRRGENLCYGPLNGEVPPINPALIPLLTHCSPASNGSLEIIHYVEMPVSVMIVISH